MSRRRTLLLAVAFAISLALVTGTSGVSSVTMTRGIDGAIVDDQRAYLGIEQTATADAAPVDLEVRITNRHPTATFTAVVVTINGTTVDLGGGGPLAPGGAVSHTFQSVPCDATAEIEASGGSLGIELERAVACA
jgi:hypothetical protein